MEEIYGLTTLDQLRLGMGIVTIATITNVSPTGLVRIVTYARRGDEVAPISLLCTGAGTTHGKITHNTLVTTQFTGTVPAYGEKCFVCEKPIPQSDDHFRRCSCTNRQREELALNIIKTNKVR